MEAPSVYRICRAHIVDDVLSAVEARQLFAANDCRGSIEGGFTFWSEFEGLRLVRCLVTPIGFAATD